MFSELFLSGSRSCSSSHLSHSTSANCAAQGFGTNSFVPLFLITTGVRAARRISGTPEVCIVTVEKPASFPQSGDRSQACARRFESRTYVQCRQPRHIHPSILLKKLFGISDYAQQLRNSKEYAGRALTRVLLARQPNLRGGPCSHDFLYRRRRGRLEMSKPLACFLYCTSDYGKC